LIVDDRAEFGPADKLKPNTSDVATRDSAREGEATAGRDFQGHDSQIKESGGREVPQQIPRGDLEVPTPEKISEASGTDELDAKLVTDRFAALGLVCGVIRPNPDDVITEIIGPAALRADILILDWRLDSDNGERSLEVIHKIVTGIDDCHRLRLIVIYTGAGDLASIVTRVAHSLEDPIMHGKTSVIAGPVHITVLAKPDARVDQDLHDTVVGFKELPDRVIEEFANAAKGLMPNVALGSFAAIRRNTHRVLKRFSQDLDAAYLGHRMLLLHPEDAETLLANLMAQEISAVLENANVGAHADEGSAESLIREAVLSAREIDPVREMARGKGLSVAEYAVSLIKSGVYSSESGLNKTQADRAHRWTSKIYATDDAEASSVDLRFAALVKSKSRYENPVPELRLGAFVRDCISNEFLLCMQPLCDSVRLVGNTQFPFLRLKSVEDGIDFVIDHLGEMHKLRLDLRIRDLQMIEFSPTANPPGVIKATWDKDASGWFFKASGQESPILWWVGELREGWAHKYANKFSNSISRVGMDDSEWARRYGTD